MENHNTFGCLVGIFKCRVFLDNEGYFVKNEWSEELIGEEGCRLLDCRLLAKTNQDGG
jgi:hypothetical protein